MANKVVGFSIQIDGIDTVGKLEAEVKRLNAEFKNAAVGSKEYDKLTGELAQAKAALGEVRKEQRLAVQSFKATSEGVGAYDKLNAELITARKAFKNLAAAGKENTDEAKKLITQIQQLDSKLKGIDASVGNFQRNVGNYPRILGRTGKAFASLIPGLDAFSEGIDRATGGSQVFSKVLIGGFVAFQAGKFIAKMIGELNELVKATNETKNAIEVLSGIGGNELNELTADVTALATTFKLDAKEIAESARALADAQGISFTEALKKIEKGLLQGQKSNDDYIKSIQDSPKAFQEAAGALDTYGRQQGELLEANRDLARSQVELSNTFAESSKGLEILGVRAKGLLFDVFNKLVLIFKPVTQSFNDLGTAVGKLFGTFNKDGEKGIDIINLMLAPIRNLANIFKFLVVFVTNFVDGFRNFIDSMPFVRDLFNEFIATGQKIVGVFMNLPALFSGVLAAIQELFKQGMNSFNRFVIDSQIAFQKIKGAFGVQVEDEIKRLKGLRKEVEDSSKGVFGAFTDAYNEELKRFEKSTQGNFFGLTVAQLKKSAADAQKVAADQLKQAEKDAEKIEKLREKFLEKEKDFLSKQAKILLSIQERTNALVIESIADLQVRQRKQEQAAFEARVQDLDNQNKALSKLNAERLEEAQKLFGANSPEAKKIREDNERSEQETQEATSLLIFQEREKRNAKLRAIDANFEQQQVKDLQDVLNKRVQLSKNEFERRSLVLEEDRATGLLNEKEYQDALFQLEKERIEAELALNELQLQQIQTLQKAGIQGEEAQVDAIKLANQRLKTALAKLNAERKQDSKSTNNDILEDFQATFALIAGYAQEALGIFSGFFDAINERQQQRIEKEQEAQQAAITALEERFNQSSGLERRFLAQRLEDEKATAERIVQEKEKIESARAKKDKARAIVESIIATALAVVKNLSIGPIASILAGVAGAAQTAIIAAQPLAEGGIVGKYDELAHFANGGRISHKGNMRPLSNGDNILATVKTGEVILNEGQQRKLGGAKTFRRIGVPGFANGGVVGGAPTTAIASASESVAMEKRRIELLEANLEATNARFDRIEVIYSNNTQVGVDKANTDRKELKRNSTF